MSDARKTHEIAQEKWSCDWPRSCLTYGLVLLALPVIWSVHHPSVLGDVIHGLDLDLAWNYGFSPSFQGKPLFPSIFQVSSTWNHPDNYRIPYGGRHHWHADGRSPTTVCHRNMLFQWLFRCLCHWKAIQWKHHIASTIMVLSLRRLWGEFPSRTYRIYHGTPAYSTCRS